MFLLIVQIVLVSISYAASRDFLPDSLRQGLDDLWDLQHEGNSTLNTYEEVFAVLLIKHFQIIAKLTTQ